MNRFAGRIKRRFQLYISHIKAIFLTTDKARWKNVEKETYKWDERNKIIASYIPKGSSVLDIGAGAQTLRNYLPANRYVPCDVILRPGTLYCDLNKGIYPSVNEKFDYVICSGVIEYLLDPETAISNLSKFGQNIILSYAPMRDTYKENKRVMDGWKNHLTEKQLEEIFTRSGLGWKILEYWDIQNIYLLHKQ